MSDAREIGNRPTPKESRGVFQAIFEQNAVGVAQIVSKPDDFVRINRRFGEIVGYTPVELTRLGFRQITHPDDLSEYLTDMQRLLAGEIREFSLEIRCVHKDGSLVWVNLTVSPMWSKGEEPDYHIAIVEDITERKRTEQVMREARDFAESLIQTANAIVVVLDEKGEIRTFNTTAERITGYTREEIGGRNWFEVLVPRERYPGVWDEFERLMAGGIPQEFENPILTKEGEERHIVWKNNELFRNGEIAGTVSFGIDITERKRAEKQLREAEQRYRLAQQLSGVGTWEWNVRTDRIFWSDEVLAIWGVEPASFKGTYDEVAARVHPDDVVRWQENVRDCLEKGKEHNIDFRVVRPDGEVRWVAAYGDAERDKKGRPLRMIGVIMDITDHKRAARERESLIAKLETQNAELERFTYTVSHDLKSPLITIKGYIGVLAEDLDEAEIESARQDLARISKAADKMENLLADLLELSRIGRLVNPPEDASFGELASEALELLHGSLVEKNIHIEILPDLPKVHGDRTRLLEVLQNLIDNAVKYMGDQPRPQIEIGTRRSGTEVVRYVRDNGIGIEPRFHEKVFELFDQLDPKIEGTGIGLALVKRIVEVHGGRIWVESEGAGRGSTFCFTLPEELEPS